MKDQDILTVGELAKKMDVTVRTLQYYDREGLLKPSSKSEGGRRLYTKKDMIKLHQILSMKFLGFSIDEIKNNLIPMDSMHEMVQILDRQKETVKNQIDNLTIALSAIEVLQKEVSQMKKVDFNKYADIIALLRLKNEGYWIIKFFDEKLSTHIKDRFADQPELGNTIFGNWKCMCDEVVRLKEQGIPPESDKGQDLAKRWWTMIIEFTGGDMSLIPELIEFNKSKQNWGNDLEKKQSIADEFLSKALGVYFQNQGIKIPEMEIEQ